jgi:hypothetical protein
MIEQFFKKKNLMGATRYRFCFFSVEIDDLIKRVSLIRFLGLRLYSCKIVDNFLLKKFLGITISKKYINRKELDAHILASLLFSQDVYPSVQNNSIVSLCGAPSGEMFLFYNLFDAFCKAQKINPDKILFVVDKKWKKNLCESFFPGKHTIFVNRSYYTYEIFRFSFEGTSIFSIFPTVHYIKQDELIRKGATHYYKEISKTLLNGKVYCPPVKEPNVKKSIVSKTIGLAKKYRLNLRNFVIVCPEANTGSSLNKIFWIKVIKNLLRHGFDVYVNVANSEGAKYPGKVFFLTHQQLFALSKYTKAVIGLRSGLIEILSSFGMPIFTVYTDIPDRGDLKFVSAKDNQKGFSLNGLLTSENKNIHEFIDTDIQNADEFSDYVIDNIG